MNLLFTNDDSNAFKEWIYWWTNEAYAGAENVTVPAPLEHIPVFYLGSRLTFWVGMFFKQRLDGGLKVRGIGVVDDVLIQMQVSSMYCRQLLLQITGLDSNITDILSRTKIYHKSYGVLKYSCYTLQRDVAVSTIIPARKKIWPIVA
jgi:hypothetical protein